jgi:hypothetical protein
MTELNKPIIRRKMGQNGFIKLTNENYDKIVTGRTITIYSTMNAMEKIGIVDIDCIDWNVAKLSTLKLYEFILNRVPVIKKVKIRYTGKNSFHLICDFGKNMNIDTIRYLLKKSLNDKEVLKDFTLEEKKPIDRKIPNIDLSPNKVNGAFITNYSLSVVGLKCLEIDYSDLMKFQRNYAKIN